MVLRLDPSMMAFRSICLTSPCSGNTFGQYRIWATEDDIRDISWVLSCPFTSGPYCKIGFASAVSTTIVSVCSPDCYLLIVIATPMVWVSAVIGWGSGDIVAGALIIVAIATCMGPKAFSVFTQDTDI